MTAGVACRVFLGFESHVACMYLCKVHSGMPASIVTDGLSRPGSVKSLRSSSGGAAGDFVLFPKISIQAQVLRCRGTVDRVALQRPCGGLELAPWPAETYKDGRQHLHEQSLRPRRRCLRRISARPRLLAKAGLHGRTAQNANDTMTGRRVLVREENSTDRARTIVSPSRDEAPLAVQIQPQVGLLDAGTKMTTGMSSRSRRGESMQTGCFRVVDRLVRMTDGLRLHAELTTASRKVRQPKCCRTFRKKNLIRRRCSLRKILR